MQNAIATIKETNPIVLTVANNVTPADVANGLNALGASPMMSPKPRRKPTTWSTSPKPPPSTWGRSTPTSAVKWRR